MYTKGLTRGRMIENQNCIQIPRHVVFSSLRVLFSSSLFFSSSVVLPVQSVALLSRFPDYYVLHQEDFSYLARTVVGCLWRLGREAWLSSVDGEGKFSGWGDETILLLRGVLLRKVNREDRERERSEDERVC